MFKDVPTRARKTNTGRRREAAAHPVCLLRLPAVMSRVGLSRSTIYARMSEGTFPKAVKLGARAIGFVQAEIDEWLRSAVKLRDLEEPR